MAISRLAALHVWAFACAIGILPIMTELSCKGGIDVHNWLEGRHLNEPVGLLTPCPWQCTLFYCIDCSICVQTFSKPSTSQVSFRYQRSDQSSAQSVTTALTHTSFTRLAGALTAFTCTTDLSGNIIMPWLQHFRLSINSIRTMTIDKSKNHDSSY